MNLNQYDVQSRHIMTTDSYAECLYAGCGDRGGQQYVLKENDVERMEQQTTDKCANVQECRGGQRMPDKDNFEAVVEEEEYEVRRLTPTECARLQGFPPTGAQTFRIAIAQNTNFGETE